MSASALNLIVREVGLDVGVELSAHVLRHTLLTALVRNGKDLVLVAEIGGGISDWKQHGAIVWPQRLTKRKFLSLSRSRAGAHLYKPNCIQTHALICCTVVISVFRGCFNGYINCAGASSV